MSFILVTTKLSFQYDTILQKSWKYADLMISYYYQCWKQLFFCVETCFVKIVWLIES